VDLYADLRFVGAFAPAPERSQAPERVRLDACIEREPPALYCDMCALRAELGEPGVPPGWEDLVFSLSGEDADVRTSLRDLSGEGLR
jgi:hypothetical protein